MEFKQHFRNTDKPMKIPEFFRTSIQRRPYYPIKKTSKFPSKMKQTHIGLFLALFSFLFVVFMAIPSNNIDIQSRKEINLVASFLAGMFGFAAIEQLRKN
ncbi:MAG: hypothetical protein ACRCU2_11710 [Planktothrix sp.]